MSRILAVAALFAGAAGLSDLPATSPASEASPLDTTVVTPEREAMSDVAYSPDGRELLVGEVDGDVLVHPLDGAPADTLTGRSGGLGAVAWAPGCPYREQLQRDPRAEAGGGVQ